MREIGRKIFFTREKMEEYLQRKFTLATPAALEKEKEEPELIPGIHRVR